jgi:hypothetical protein
MKARWRGSGAPCRRPPAPRAGAPADTTGLLSGNFIPEYGSAWLYYYSRRRAAWLRAPVDIERAMPALRGE